MTQFKTISLITLSCLLMGCTSKTLIRSAPYGLSLKINKEPIVNFNSYTEQTYKTTTFGSYHFKASSKINGDMYGRLPLSFNDGYLIADILFFSPAALFNLRETYPFYKIDTNEKVIYYKDRERDKWIPYKPKDEEIAEAKEYFTNN